MLLIFSLVIAYFLIGITEVLNDFNSPISQQPIWTYNPTKKQILFHTISWPLKIYFNNVHVFRGNNRTAIILNTMFQILFSIFIITINIYCSYLISSMVVDSVLFRIVLTIPLFFLFTKTLPIVTTLTMILFSLSEKMLYKSELVEDPTEPPPLMDEHKKDLLVIKNCETCDSTFNEKRSIHNCKFCGAKLRVVNNNAKKRVTFSFTKVATLALVIFFSTKFYYKISQGELKKKSNTYQAKEISFNNQFKNNIYIHKAKDGDKYLVLEGFISLNMFESFKYMIEKNKISKVMLMSNGGSAYEAIKIGRYIRSKKLSTFAPSRTIDGFSQCEGAKPKKAENCNCASACFLIHSAGTYRYGNQLGLHRVYLDHIILRSLDSNQAEKLQLALNNDVKTYLSSMDVSNSIIDKVLHTNSKRISYMSQTELSSYLGFIPKYEEWALSKCGDYKKAIGLTNLSIRLYEAKKINRKDLIRIYNQVKKTEDCIYDLMDQLTKESSVAYLAK